MTSQPDPVDSGDLDLPRDPADYGPRRRGLGLAFWAMIVFGLVCILAGVAIDRFGPTWFPVRPTPPSAPPPASSLSAAPAAPAITPVPAVAQPGAATDAPVEVAALAARVDRLEANQRRAAQASSEALAAASLGAVARGSGPFADQIAPLSRLLPDSPDWRALQVLAQTGAPSRSSLASEFADLADRAAVASRKAPEGSGPFTRLAHALEAVFTIRRIDRLTGDDPDALLARAERRVDDGDLEAAIRALDALPPAGRSALADWLVRAQRRVEIDRLVAAIGADASRNLADASAPGAAP